MSPARLVAPRRNPFAWPRALWLVLGLVIVLAIVLGTISNIIVDWLWFSSLGYRSVFLTVLGAKLGLFATIFAATTVLLWINGAVAARAARPPIYLMPANSPWAPAAVLSANFFIPVISQSIPESS